MFMKFTYLTDKITRLDQQIEAFAEKEEYQELVKKLCCFMGIKSLTVLTTLVEIGGTFSRRKEFCLLSGIDARRRFQWSQ